MSHYLKQFHVTKKLHLYIVCLCFHTLCCFSVTQLCPALCEPVDCSMPGIPVLHHIPEVAQTHVHWVGDAIQTSCPVISFLSCLQPFPASESFPISWLFASGAPKFWSFSFSISPSNEYSGLISFRSHWFYLLAVKGSQESSPTPQFKSINSSALSIIYDPTLTSIHDY